MRRTLSLGLLVCITAVLIASCSEENCCCTCRYNCADIFGNCNMQGDVLVCSIPDGYQVPEQDATDTAEPSEVKVPDLAPTDLPPVADERSPEDAEDTAATPDLVDLVADLAEPEVAEDLQEEDLEPQGPAEFRGIWVSRWDYTSASDVTDIMENAKKWGFNAVMFQVRGQADAYYQSNVEPWAKGLSGTLGQNPGWNPLQVAIDQGHARGLEVHAWLNTFPAWTGTAAIPLSSPHHILYDHPEWRVHGADGQPMAYNSSYVFVSPGIPGVRTHILNVITDIVENYDVDGIHLDYIRYAGPEYSHDPDSEAAYTQAKAGNPGLTWGDFQRDLLSDFVGLAYQTITSLDPSMKLTTAVWGIYQDSFGWGGTSEGYWDYYQDSHRWISEGLVDAICPMIYWEMTTPKGGWTDFATLADDFWAAAGGRHVYMGINVDYPSVTEILDQVEYTRSIGAPGSVLFSYAGILDANFGPAIKSGVYSDPLPTPVMPWK